MPQEHGPYHRLGGPGEPGCPVAIISVQVTKGDGYPAQAQLFDAGTKATELELLRTVAKSMGVFWGSDDLGWWTVVPEPDKK